MVSRGNPSNVYQQLPQLIWRAHDLSLSPMGIAKCATVLSYDWAWINWGTEKAAKNEGPELNEQSNIFLTNTKQHAVTTQTQSCDTKIKKRNGKICNIRSTEGAKYICSVKNISENNMLTGDRSYLGLIVATKVTVGRRRWRENVSVLCSVSC